MKIVDACRIDDRGHAIITDEAFTTSGFAHARTRKKIRVVGAELVLELEITDTEAVLKKGGKEFLGFLVPLIDDEAIRESIVVARSSLYEKRAEHGAALAPGVRPVRISGVVAPARVSASVGRRRARTILDRIYRTGQNVVDNLFFILFIL